MNYPAWFKKIMKFEKQATPLPWEAQEPWGAPGIGFGRVKGPQSTKQYHGAMCFNNINDAELIAALRNNYPQIKQAIEELVALKKTKRHRAPKQ